MREGLRHQCPPVCEKRVKIDSENAKMSQNQNRIEESRNRLKPLKILKKPAIITIAGLVRLTGFEPTTFGSGDWLDDYHSVSHNALQYLQIRMITGKIHISIIAQYRRVTRGFMVS